MDQVSIPSKSGQALLYINDVDAYTEVYVDVSIPSKSGQALLFVFIRTRLHRDF